MKQEIVYIANDGTRFADKSECVRYEAKTRLKNIRFYSIHFKPNETGFTKLYRFAIESNQPIHGAIISEVAFHIFGHMLQKTQSGFGVDTIYAKQFDVFSSDYPAYEACEDVIDGNLVEYCGRFFITTELYNGGISDWPDPIDFDEVLYGEKLKEKCQDIE